MKNISAATDSNNASLSATVPFPIPSKAEGIALCSAFALETVLIVVGNFLTVVPFAFNKKLRKRSMFLVVNMAFADAMLGAVALPLYIYLSLGSRYQLWANEAHVFLSIFRQIFEAIFGHASLISAVFMSCERCYAIYWPLKHRILSMRAYRVVIFMVWTLTILVSAVYLLLLYLISNRKRTYSVWISFPLTCLFIICACNISICRKFKKSNIASQRQNRSSQKQRLTSTLLFVSIIAVLSWLPLVIVHYLTYVQEVFMPRTVLFFSITRILLYSNSFVNPFVYALRIPAFGQALGKWHRLRRQAEINRRDNERGENMAAALTAVMQLRTLATVPSHPQLEFEQESFDTEL